MANRRKRAQDGDYHQPAEAWFVEIWREFRPYLVRLGTDFLIFLAIWLLLLGAHTLTTRLPLGSTLSRFLVGFHETVVVLTFVWLSLEATWDIVMLRRKM